MQVQGEEVDTLRIQVTNDQRDLARMGSPLPRHRSQPAGGTGLEAEGRAEPRDDNRGDRISRELGGVY